MNWPLRLILIEGDDKSVVLNTLYVTTERSATKTELYLKDHYLDLHLPLAKVMMTMQHTTVSNLGPVLFRFNL